MSCMLSKEEFCLQLPRSIEHIHGAECMVELLKVKEDLPPELMPRDARRS